MVSSTRMNENERLQAYYNRPAAWLKWKWFLLLLELHTQSIRGKPCGSIDSLQAKTINSIEPLVLFLRLFSFLHTLRSSSPLTHFLTFIRLRWWLDLKLKPKIKSFAMVKLSMVNDQRLQGVITTHLSGCLFLNKFSGLGEHWFITSIWMKIIEWKSCSGCRRFVSDYWNLPRPPHQGGSRIESSWWDDHDSKSATSQFL